MISLKRASTGDAELVWKMQVASFKSLLEKYEDYDTNPGNEPLEYVLARLEQPFTYFYLIRSDEDTIGAIRVVDTKQVGERKRIAPIFILPEHQGRGFAQQTIGLAEEIHGHSNWMLDTILQEPGNCYLYEKMGYHRTGEQTVVNEKMTLVYYHKD